MAKTDMTVVRNAAYRGGEFSVRERHNERKNENYHNGDIDPARADMNVHFRRYLSPDDEPETYQQTFNRLLDEGTIVKWRLPKDPHLFDELVFDVNTDYFERNGGYEYAKKFYEEAYRCAVKEIGGEQYILSAVLHADERNKALSEQLGHDVYHYHLHVVYVPIVETEIYHRKNCKDKSLAGTLDRIIPQITHSKKWPIKLPVERDGKTIILNSYSLLQDRYFEHMRAAGFEGFERGERGSTIEHLDVLDFKIQQDNKRLDTLAAAADERQKELYVLGEKMEKKEKQLERLDAKITVREKAKATIAEIDSMGKTAMLGGVNFTNDEAAKLKTLAKKSITADEKAAEASRKRKAAETERDEYKAKYDEEVKKRTSLTGHITEWGKYQTALKRAPKRLGLVIDEIMSNPPEPGHEPPQRVQKSHTRGEICG